ncbi:DHA2 family efflux MFS transporter permease subunit [Myxococcota bacterium]|nr:DHA2 family efflux MFS transporter permease subunit [Myxococcota bacterium]
MIGMVMSIIDSSIVNVALPHMMGTYGAGVGEIAWVVTGYTLSNVIIIPLSAWLASLFGRSRLYGWTVVAFTAASALCGIAPSLPALIAARILQGFAAGLLMPMGQAILYESFPPEKRGASMAVFGLGIMVGPAIGPTLGGWLTDTWGWPWIFFINLPIGIVGALLVPVFLHDPPYLRRRRSARGDLVGVALLAAGIGIAQYVLEEGSSDGWFDADWIVVAAAAAVLLLGAFVVWELDHDDPAVDLRVFSDANFRSTIIINVVIGVGLMGGMFVLPLYIQQVMGLTATMTGLVLLPGAVATAVAMSISGRLTDLGYARSQVAIGLLVFAGGMLLMSRLTADAGMGDLLIPQMCRGIGMGFTFVPLSVVAVLTIPKSEMGHATGMINLTRRLGGSLGIAWLASVLSDTQVERLQQLVGHVDPFRDVAADQVHATADALSGLGLDPASAQHAAVLLTYKRVATAAADMAFQHVFLVLVLLFVGSLPLLLLLRSGKRARTVP